MSKISDLKYYMNKLSSEIDNIQDEKIKNKIQKVFYKLEEKIVYIESDIEDVQYIINELKR